MTENISEKQRICRKLGHESVYLAACAIHNTVPAARVDMDLQALFKFCKFHSITSCVAMALDKAWAINPGDPAVMKQWREARDKAIRKNILLNAERERILAHLESIGCWYMPLKGSLLQYDYPKFGMRQMSDNDLLCDPAKSKEIHRFMAESGYTCEQFNKGHHDEYNRKPVYNFEIHRSLFKPEEAPELAAYFADIHERSQKDPENQFGYHLSRSDFYIYFTAHALNHFQESGIGIRYLMDVYVFLKKYAPELDRGYVDRELERLGALEFERWSARISETLFARPSREPEIGEEDQSLLDAFFCSGSHGTEEQLFQKAYAKFTASGKGSRFRYFFSRMFPSAKLLGVAYPIVRKHKWMVPFVWIYRLVLSVLRSPGRVYREVSSFFRRQR